MSDSKNLPMYQDQVKRAKKRELEAISEAQKYRELWNAAASCLAHNKDKIRPRGEDERVIIQIASKSDHGHFWSGETKGWLEDK